MTDKELLQAFKKEIRERGWTVEEAAKKINVAASTIFHWQKAQRIGRRGRIAIAALLKGHDNISITAPNNSGTVIGKNVGNGAPVDFSAAIRKIMASARLTDAEKLKVIDVLNN